MAVCFALVVDFGDDAGAALAASRIEPWPSTLDAGGLQIPLHPPTVSTEGASVRLRVLPMAVGYGVSTDGSLPRFDLTKAQLKELTHGLYQLLARFEGYRTAMVDWDPECFLDVDDLAELWSDDLSEGTLPGLVIAEHLHTRLPLGPTWVPFSPGYLWLPHEPQ